MIFSPRARTILLASAVFTVMAPAFAETWPDRAVKWTVPFSPGGANDLVARAVQ